MQEDKNGFAPVFDTLAILDQSDKTRRSRVSLPSEAAVDAAKDWVDGNEK